MQKLMTGAQILFECLLREGVEVMYGHPGGCILPTYDTMTQYPQIHHVLARHEQGASHMADGYARATGKVGVAIATSGPGATNLVTGIATAMMDSSPIVCITGQVPQTAIGSDAFQEVDITGVTIPITKHSYLVTDVEDLAYTVKEAFHIARSGRPGPVLIDIPKDVQLAQCAFVYPEEPIRLPGVREIPPFSEAKLKEAARLIGESKRPVILVGRGVVMSGSTREVVALAEQLNSPVALTLLGKGGVPESHPLCLGMMGMHGTGQANHAIQEADLLIALGMRFDDRVTGNLKTYAPNAKKIHIDIDASEFNKCVKVDVAIHGDVRQAVTELLPIAPAGERKEWWARISEWVDESRQREILNADNGEFMAAHAVHELWKATGGDGTVVTDVGQHQMLEAQYYPHERPRSLITSGGLGTMGFALPAAIGASMGLNQGWARREAPQGSKDVWVVAGDGGFQMTMCELATAVQEKLPLKICVVNNGFLGMVRQWQEMFYDKRYHATPMLSPNFVALAAAYGIPGRRVERREDVAEAVAWAQSITDGPVLLDLAVEQHDIVYPMVAPGADLHNMVRRPNATVTELVTQGAK